MRTTDGTVPAGLPADESAKLPPAERSPYGVCQRVYYDRLLQRFRQGGIQWITFGVEWRAHEAQEGVIVWDVPNHRMSKVDTYLPVLARGEMALMMLIVDPPQWARAKALAAGPDEPRGDGVLLADYLRFMEAFLDRCVARGVKPAAWMITNETTTGGSFHDRDPRRWVDFYKASYAAVKKRFPDCPVLMDGMWGVDMHHLEELYELGINHYFDAANFHYYPEETNEAQALGGWAGHPGWSRYITPSPVQVNVNDLAFQIQYLHEVMKRHGDVKPIWITECGWREQTEGQKAQYLLDTLDICRRSGVVERFFWYIGSENDHMSLFFDPQWAQCDKDFDQRWEKGITPAYLAYRAYTRRYPTWPMTPAVVNHIRPADRPIEIPDGGFEEPGKWQNVTYDTQVRHDGRSSARLDAADNQPLSSAEITVPCQEQRAYLLTGWMKVQEKPSPARGGPRGGEVFHAQFDVWMRTWARRGPAIGNYFVADTSLWPDSWRPIRVPIVTTPGSNKLTIRLSCWFGPGTVWFDDLKIEPLEIPRVPLRESWNVPTSGSDAQHGEE